jgi:hypothetical protein
MTNDQNGGRPPLCLPCMAGSLGGLYSTGLPVHKPDNPLTATSLPSPLLSPVFPYVLASGPRIDVARQAHAHDPIRLVELVDGPAIARDLVHDPRFYRDSLHLLGVAARPQMATRPEKVYILPRSDLNHVVIVPQDEVKVWRSVERDLQPVPGRVDDVKVARFRARRWRRGGSRRRGRW